MLRKHHKPRFIFYQLKWILFQKANPEAPWLTPLSIDLINHLLKKSDYGLEFGSGRSTKWLASRCNHLISVEQNKEWFNWITSQLENYKNGDYNHLKVDQNNFLDSEYLSVFKNLSSNSLDFILNDGKIRDLIALQSFDKLKNGGILIRDNAERYLPNNFKIPESIGEGLQNLSANWKNFCELTKDFRRIWTCDGVSSTLFLFKP